MCRDPESNLQVLLMELLDESLTKLLERSPHPIPYDIQVDLCSDVSLAVAYLHSNGIIHRDLSGNNVLVIAGRRAKVTDFGMSKLTGAKQQTHLTFCPGTHVYMSPESLKEPPQYTEKLDVFSLGVIIIQICTREFPDPKPAMKEIEDPRSLSGKSQVPILEEERRKNHIDLINPNHPLLPIAISCIQYEESDRPDAEELCQQLDTLKENSSDQVSARNPSPPDVNIALQEERNQLARQVHEQIRETDKKDQQIVAKDEQIATHYKEMKTKFLDFTKKIAEKDQELADLKKKFQELSMKLQDSEKVNKQPQAQGRDDLFQNKSHPQQKAKVARKTHLVSVKGWKYGEKAPFSSSGCCSIVNGKVAYFLSRDRVYLFNFPTGKWNIRLPSCPHVGGSLAIVQGLLTMVGGWLPVDSETTNKLISLTKTESGKWIEHFPPMPTSRRRTTATTYLSHLIVAGGLSTAFNIDNLDTVEVLDTGTLVWSTVASLPHAFANGSATICGDYLYILGGNDKDGPCGSVFSCALPDLLQCHRKGSILSRMLKLKQPKAQEDSQVWQRITDTPMYESTCVTVRGQLLAVGGRDDSHERTPAVYKYDLKCRSWNVISRMSTARNLCYVAVIDTDTLLVVGGAGTDSVEITQL